jgi:hypothetical protein
MHLPKRDASEGEEDDVDALVYHSHLRFWGDFAAELFVTRPLNVSPTMSALCEESSMLSVLVCAAMGERTAFFVQIE